MACFASGGFREPRSLAWTNWRCRNYNCLSRELDMAFQPAVGVPPASKKNRPRAAASGARVGPPPSRPWFRWQHSAARGRRAALFGTISSIYYFLPGPYEWDSDRGKDLLVTWMLPPLGVAGWSLSSGRFNLL